MSTMTRNTAETSVTFSLAELAKLEEARVREEGVLLARAREKEARELRETEASRRAAEAARMAGEAEARARRVREEAAEKVRIEARERVAVDVARIEAEAKVRLEADNAMRAHELAVLRSRTEGGQRRLVGALAAVLGLVLCGGGATAYGASRHVAALEQDAERLHEGQTALARERERAKEAELSALDRRFAALRARPLVRDAEEARVTAEAAWSAVDAKAPDHGRMRAFGDALDVLQTRIEALEKLALLDRRQADLVTWAAERKRTESTVAARTAAARARAMSSDEGALRAYEVALDQLRDTLAQPGARSGSRQLTTSTDGAKGACAPSDPGCCAPSDPGCGLDGQRLF